MADYERAKPEVSVMLMLVHERERQKESAGDPRKKFEGFSQVPRCWEDWLSWWY